MNIDAGFREAFRALTGNEPLQWQWRLFRDHFANGSLCNDIDLPTGLGKTMVMAIWLIARASKLDVPTRLIYVVDRRTVVDQATDIAEQFAYLLSPHDPKEDERVVKRHPKLVERKQQHSELLDELRQNLGHDRLAISPLRGQLADNREWSRDPTRPAIVIGTVDLIGSALLFSGYRSSFKRRPLEAGLLGQDSLLVLDEAHLSKPFEKLLGSVDSFQSTRGAGVAPVKPMRVIRMSATSSTDPATRAFRLEGDFESRTGDFADDTIRARFNATKRLTVITSGEKELNKPLAQAAIALARRPELVGKRIVVFVRKPDDAMKIAAAIRNHEASKSKPGPYADSVEVLTGTMRGLERDQLVEKTVFKDRWLNGDLKPDDSANESPVFLISTSAGEVGFDLNADHMVCDATTVDSLIQRLGRVNRRGFGDAQVHLLVESPKKDKVGKPKKFDGLDLAIANTIDLLQGVSLNQCPVDVSPKNIAELKSDDWKDKYAAACSPEPGTVDLTDILLDAWSMTSITERMPGRPEVGPWLRGTDDEQAQTSVAWRAELELLSDDPSPEEALRAIFIKHPIRPHELLAVNTGHLLEFLKRIPKLKDRPADLMSARVAIRLSRGKIVCRTAQQLIDQPGILYADSTLILPAKFGGLDGAGLLDAESIPRIRSDSEAEASSLDVADHPDYGLREDAPPRLRVMMRRTEDGHWTPESLSGGTAIAERQQIAKDYPTSTALLNALRQTKRRIRLVLPIDRNVDDEIVRSLVLLSPTSNFDKSEDQLLTKHVGLVECEARRIADALGLAESNPVRVALLFGARWHDEGKKADIWQRFVRRVEDEDFKGKSSRTRDPKSLRGYRHEFGSLLRIQHPERCGTTGCELPTDADARELALHLIATHHGAGRPHFGSALYDPFSDVECDANHLNCIRRFARLQRKYGWWHLAWLENLLRCADALASADQEAEDDPADTEGGAA